MMNVQFVILVVLTTTALCAGVSQRFFTSFPRYRVGTIRNSCYSPVTAVRRAPVLYGVTYRAFSICTDGQIRLHPYKRHAFKTYRYPSIAPFQSKSANAQCRNSRILYGQTCNRFFLARIKAVVNDLSFNPQTALWVQYDNIHQLTCSRKKTNSFEVILATQNRVTYAIFIYGRMGWDKLCKRCSAPFVGYADSKRVGYRYALPTNAACHLRHSIKIFRISDTVRRNVQVEVDQEAVLALQEAMNGEESQAGILQSDDKMAGGEDGSLQELGATMAPVQEAVNGEEAQVAMVGDTAEEEEITAEEDEQF